MVLRGYRAGATGENDEQVLLREALPGVPVVAGRDRLGAARTAASADCFVLDDGFQHRRVRRAFDLVLIDATRPFGGGRLLPRGLLREPADSLRRASAVLVTRLELADDPAAVLADVRLSAGEVPVYESRFLATAGVAGRRARVVCAIGNPAAFEATVRRLGAEVVETRLFPDHHRYAPADMASVAAGGLPVVTTAKDWVKLRHLWPAGREVHVVGQGVEVEGADGLVGSVVAAIGSRRGA